MLHLALNNTLDAIGDSRPALLEFFARHQLGERATNRLEVIFEEVVSNAVRHGFRPGSSQSVRVQARLAGGNVELTFEDDGAVFNPLAAPAPAPLSSLETAPEGGLGILLLRRLAAAIRYETPDGRGEAGFRPNNRVVVEVAATP